MNDTSNNERNEQWARIMAIVGFVVMICLLAWLAVQVVRFIPTVFSSLASVFESNQRALDDRTGDDNQNVVIINEEEDEEESDTVVAVNSDVDVATTTPSTTPTPTPTNTTSNPTTQYKTVVTYKTPVSDPNGYTDLAVSFVAVGRLTSTEKFVPSDSIEAGERSAMQFRVKNVGTKTSTDWRFVAEMANDNAMTSAVQLPLKPGETTTLTIAFDAVDKTSNSFVGASVIGGNDTNLSNNGFRLRVAVR